MVQAEDYPELLREIVFSKIWLWGKVRHEAQVKFSLKHILM